MSDMTCITSFLDNPRFTVSLVTNISSTYFNWLYDFFLRGKSLSYVIGLLQKLCKKLAAVIWGMGSLPKSKPPSSHTSSTFVLLSISRCFFNIDQLSSFHHKGLFAFLLVPYYPLVTVAVSWSAKLSDHDSKDIKAPKPKTNLSWTVTLIYDLHSSRLDFSWCVLLNFFFPSLLILKYSWI